MTLNAGVLSSLGNMAKRGEGADTVTEDTARDERSRLKPPRLSLLPGLAG